MAHEPRIVRQDLFLGYVVVAVAVYVHRILPGSVELHAAGTAADTAILRRVVKLRACQRSGRDHRQTPAYLRAQRDDVGELLRQPVVRLDDLEPGGGIQPGGVLDESADEIRRAPDARSGVGDAVGHDVLPDLAYAYAGALAVLQGKQLPVDDYKSRNPGVRHPDYVTSASDKREALQQLCLRLQEIKSLD